MIIKSKSDKANTLSTNRSWGKNSSKMIFGSRKRDEVYVMTLLRFVNNEMVYNENEISRLNNLIFEHNKNIIKNTMKKRKSKYDKFDYVFTKTYANRIIDECITDVHNASYGKELLEHIELYYYHHRIILKFIFKIDKKTSKERLIRNITKSIADRLIIENFIDRINDITQKTTESKSPENLIPYEKRIVLYYSYVVMFINNIKGFGNHITDFLGSLTFRIVESGKIRFGNIHYVRISIPSMNVYYNKKLSDFLKTDIINSVYQNALYLKKESDLEESKLEDFNDFYIKNLNKYNVLQEKHLHALWSYAQDNLGGKISDIQNKYMEKKSYLLSIFAILISIAAILITIK